MGWGDCGTDRQGRPIGYAFEATCDQPNCDAKIDRGLSYACGGMHGEADHYCEKYFCPKHLLCVELADGDVVTICAECEKWAPVVCDCCEEKPATEFREGRDRLCVECVADQPTSPGGTDA